MADTTTEALVHSVILNYGTDGTIVVFGATTVEDGAEVRIAVDHRCAQVLAEALEYEEPLVDVESWQIIGSVTP